jgi:hypothetical protein
MFLLEQQEQTGTTVTTNNSGQLSTPIRGNKPTFADVRNAINEKRFVWIWYQPDGFEKGFKIQEGWRLIEPYVFGQRLQAKPRRYRLRYPYQRYRYYLRVYVLREVSTFVNDQKMNMRPPSVSLSKDEPFWRMIRMDKIESWKPIEYTFNVAKPGYNPNDKDLANIITAAKF